MDNILYIQFEKMCYKANYNELKQFIEKYNIDLNYDDYDYINIISSRNDIKLLELFIDHNADIHYNDDELLGVVIDRNNYDIVNYLIKHHKFNINKLSGCNSWSKYWNNKKMVV